MAQAEYRSDYHTRPARAGLLIGLPLLVAGLLSSDLTRIALLALAAGPLGWAGLQRLRRGRGVRLYAEYLLVQRSISGRVARIPYADLRGHAVTRRGGLALVYREPEKPVSFPVTSPGSALRSDERTEGAPRQRLLLTARLDGAAALADQIAARREKYAPGDPGEGTPSLPTQHVQAMAQRRRLRDALIILLLLLSLPLWIIMLL